MIAENLLLTQQLIVLRRARRRAPHLTLSDRLLCGFGSLFLDPGRIRTLVIALCPSTLLAFHQALVRGKYRRLCSSRTVGTSSNAQLLPDDEELETHRRRPRRAARARLARTSITATEHRVFGIDWSTRC